MYFFILSLENTVVNSLVRCEIDRALLIVVMVNRAAPPAARRRGKGRDSRLS